MNLKRKLAAYSAVLIVAAGAAAVIGPNQAQAHGAPLIPGSRTYFCYVDGLTPQGNIVPQNPACAAAVAQSGDNSLYNWFGVLRSDAAGRTTGYIPDNRLCSGNNPTYLGYDLARSDWPVTHLTAGRNIEFRYNNWANHPGTFFLYVTRNGWSPTQGLAWSDLEPFGQVTDPPAIGGPGSIDGHYRWNMNLPSGKSGRHIIYMRWVRSDSAENFFSCSDVVFDGGNGEVTGIGQGGTTSPPPGGGDPEPGNGACNVSVAVTSSWSGGYQATATVRAAPDAINGWTATLTSPAGQSVSEVWNASVVSQSGQVTQVRNAGWNAQVAANGSTSFGFIGTSSGGTAATPTATCSSP